MTDPKKLVRYVGMNTDLMPRPQPDANGNARPLAATRYDPALLAAYLRAGVPAPALAEYREMLSPSSDHPFKFVRRWRKRGNPKSRPNIEDSQKLWTLESLSEQRELADMIDPKSKHPYKLLVKKRGRGRRSKLTMTPADETKQLALVRANQANNPLKKQAMYDLIDEGTIRSEHEFFKTQRLSMPIQHFWIARTVDELVKVQEGRKLMRDLGLLDYFDTINDLHEAILMQINNDSQF